MIRLFAIAMTCLGLLMPATVSALWLQNSGACDAQPASALPGLPEHATEHSAAQLASELTEQDASIIITSDGCDGFDDPTDISNNVCFELAEHPISTLPDLIAQTQAERAAAQLLAQTIDLLPPAVTTVDDALSTPDEVRLAKPRSLPRHAPNACAVYPDNCETAPTLPTLNLDGTPNANTPSGELNLPPPRALASQHGCAGTGAGPAAGVFSRLDRPPQFR